MEGFIQRFTSWLPAAVCVVASLVHCVAACGGLRGLDELPLWVSLKRQPTARSSTFGFCQRKAKTKKTKELSPTHPRQNSRQLHYWTM
jgi:hypothetical protein